ncbi:S8 family peptidase [Streptomyces ureilyticus]|uniref:S8 family serine peptidase n=1 Tax=Streptomyces ureilyticus TaxID=1775131 RepID=A0ABX0E5M3_9ACTN|nr:S8 family serine peptidase [Streptomyces ureilyticus]NGO48993.1 S8 family serine peptidase [Streptomyces ureilyticus]
MTREYRPAANRWDSGELAQGLDRTYRLILRSDAEVPEPLLVQLRALPSVEEARRLEIVAAPVPSPVLSRPASIGTRIDRTGLGYAKVITKGDARVKIAVLDTGVDVDHPELAGKVVAGADFVELKGMDTSAFVGDISGYDAEPGDDIGHGTHVSGIIAGLGLRMAEGVAPDCRLLAVRVLATMRDGDKLIGAGLVDNINPAIKWAVDSGADIINMSLGVKHEGGGLPHADVIRYAIGKGVAVVAASGNDGSAERYYPGALPGVVAVGAAGPDGGVTAFTSYGAQITVLAPGVDVHSSYAHGGYAVASGTSQASPYVAGGIGLLKSYALERQHRLGNAEILDILRHTSDKPDRRPRSEHAGYGLINLVDAFKLLSYSLN